VLPAGACVVAVQESRPAACRWSTRRARSRRSPRLAERSLQPFCAVTLTTPSVSRPPRQNGDRMAAGGKVRRCRDGSKRDGSQPSWVVGGVRIDKSADGRIVELPQLINHDGWRHDQPGPFRAALLPLAVRLAGARRRSHGDERWPARATRCPCPRIGTPQDVGSRSRPSKLARTHALRRSQLRSFDLQRVVAPHRVANLVQRPHSATSLGSSRRSCQ
jgi:hypothetical protein